MEVEKLKNIISMLQSTDKENHTVALTLLENVDYNECFVQLLLAYKQGHAKAEAWIADAPSAYDFIKGKAVMSDTNITFNDIFQAIIKHKYPVEQMQLFLLVFTEYLKDQCQSLGYSFIEEIEMNVKLKETTHVNAT
jgi:hypothetical protein